MKETMKADQERFLDSEAAFRAMRDQAEAFEAANAEFVKANQELHARCSALDDKLRRTRENAALDREAIRHNGWLRDRVLAVESRLATTLAKLEEKLRLSSDDQAPL